MTSTSPRIKKPARTLLWVLLDVLLVNASLFLAQVVRYSSNISYSFFENSIRLAPAMTVIFLLVFCGFGMYRTMWQYASANDVLRIALATLVASLITYLFSLAANAFVRPQNLFRLHRMVYLLFWIISMAMVGASRLLYRIVVTRERFALLSTPRDDVRRVMVVGAGWAGASIVHEMQRGSYGNRAPVLVVDDDRIRTGSELSGVPVVRGSGNILKLASDYRVDEIIIAIATPKGDLKPLIEKCLATGCRVRRLAPLQELGSDAAVPTALVRDVNIGDLLGRPEEQLDMTPVAAFFRGKTVLITGGGGSIGSELCRRLLPLEPERIILYDISENYMYDLFSELQAPLRRRAQGKAASSAWAPSATRSALDEIFARYRPEVVLHAAAHKHVPLMEDCPDQAVNNNVFGTLADRAGRGAPRREALRAHLHRQGRQPHQRHGGHQAPGRDDHRGPATPRAETEFTAVRFGNVLGSHGSVVPLFEQQIRAGGPVTLTHPDIIRYFMTIPEARLPGAQGRAASPRAGSCSCWTWANRSRSASWPSA